MASFLTKPSFRCDYLLYQIKYTGQERILAVRSRRGKFSLIQRRPRSYYVSVPIAFEVVANGGRQMRIWLAVVFLGRRVREKEPGGGQ
jgi:hypothetical protein